MERYVRELIVILVSICKTQEKKINTFAQAYSDAKRKMKINYYRKININIDFYMYI